MAGNVEVEVSGAATSEFSIPLLVRKLSVFRKGLVRERNLRTQAEASLDRVREKLKASQAALNDETLKAAQQQSRAEDLERRVKRFAVQRSTEGRALDATLEVKHGRSRAAHAADSGRQDASGREREGRGRV